jgi:hypothetical protein
VNKKNSWDKTARVFIQVRVWLKRSLGQSEGGGMGRGHVLLEEQAVEGNGPKRRPVVHLESRYRYVCSVF